MADKGLAFGYHANSSKLWLVVKEEHLPKAESIFTQAGIHITCTGRQHLGAALGTPDFVKEYIMEKVAAWKTHRQIRASHHFLSIHSWPHWPLDVLPENCRRYIPPLEDTIRQQFLSALTGRNSPSDMEHELLALPSRHGGLGLVNPMTMVEEHTSSLQVTEPLHDCTYQAAER